MREWLNLAQSVARQAGDEILRYEGASVDVEHKGDGSPLTLADQAAHRCIMAALKDTPWPVVSEEGDSLHMEALRYWLVDPLDGTKDFLAGNGEYTVNIALVDQGRAVLGVVFAPASDTLYAGGQALGAQRVKSGLTEHLVAHPASLGCRMAVSRFHDHPDVEGFAQHNRIAERVAVGSALKYGLLAAAEVDVFPRLVGSSEWDTAAGQAVLEAAGGQVLDWRTGQPLRYGKPSRRNPRLLSFRSPYRLDDFLRQTYADELP